MWPLHWQSEMSEIPVRLWSRFGFVLLQSISTGTLTRTNLAISCCGFEIGLKVIFLVFCPNNYWVESFNRQMRRKTIIFCLIFNCRRNGVCYRPADATAAYLKSATYYGELAKNMHCRCKEHETKFNSKNAKTRLESAFHKHLVTAHGDRDPEKNFSDYYEVEILKASQKPGDSLRS